MTPHEINDKDNFIMAWRFEDTAFCDDIVEYYGTQEPSRGLCGRREVDLEKKDSYDALLGYGMPHADKYFERLQKCVNAYIEKYKYCDEQSAWTVMEGVNIQKYLPKGGYHKWHCERGGQTHENNARYMVFMTYLNDVTDAGETEFFYQNLKIKPEKGLTVIWPVDWMFTHRGIASPTQEKMIVTGWFSFKTPSLMGV